MHFSLLSFFFEGSTMKFSQMSKGKIMVEHKIASKTTMIPFILVTALFFFWGVPNNLNDILIKQFMKSFELTRFEAGLLQSAFYMGYFLLSMPAALIMRKFNYKTGLVTGLLLFSIGTFIFYPAAIICKFEFFLFALFVIASGLAFLETGANSFIAVLGDPESSERRLNFSQAFNPIGAIVGVLVGTFFILSGVELSTAQIAQMKAAGTYQGYLNTETMRVVAPYMVISAITFIWAILLMRTKFPHLNDEHIVNGKEEKGSFKELFRFRHFKLGALAQFFYVGAQVGTWSYFILYAQDYAHMAEKTAGYFLAGTLGAFLVGRFSAAYIMRFIKPSKLMGIFAIINIGLVGISIASPSLVGLWAVLITSFFMSLMFPTIFALGVKGLGPNTKIGGSIIIMGIVGGAVFTPIMGLVAKHSMALAMFVPLCCYIYITYYAFVGSEPKGPLYEGNFENR
jgi:FHS family L-fucose permease-like MFS transporter